jgi:hypothetical protein
MPDFPPPDPHEQTWYALSEGAEIPAPTAVFPLGPASPQADRIADLVLDARPGLFIVLDAAA